MKVIDAIRVEGAIEELGLTQEEIDRITLKNLEKICEMARCDLLELMDYLRFKRK